MEMYSFASVLLKILVVSGAALLMLIPIKLSREGKGASALYRACKILLLLFVIPLLPNPTFEIEVKVETKTPISQAVVEYQPPAQPSQIVATGEVFTPENVHTQENVERKFRLSDLRQYKNYIEYTVCIIIMLGCLLTVLRQISAAHSLRKLTKLQRECTADEKTAFVAAKRCLDISRDFEVKQLPCITAPMLIGLFKPTVYIPQDTHYSHEQLAMILRHELVHYKRHDLWVRLGMFLLQCVYFWNPIFLMVRRELLLQCEVSCDEQVIADFDEEKRNLYIDTVLLSVSGRQSHKLTGAAYFSPAQKHAKRRILTMLNFKENKTHKRILIGIICAAAVSATVIIAAFANYVPVEVQADIPVDPPPQTTAITTAQPLQNDTNSEIETHPEPPKTLEEKLALLDEKLGEAIAPVSLDECFVSETVDLNAVTAASDYASGFDMHVGVDFAGVPDTEIYAIMDGTVTLSEYYLDYGKAIMLDHGDGISTLYAHCASLEVQVGDSVKKGDLIAKIGQTGRATGNHLHLEIMLGEEKFDPLLFLPIDISQLSNLSSSSQKELEKKLEDMIAAEVSAKTGVDVNVSDVTVDGAAANKDVYFTQPLDKMLITTSFGYNEFSGGTHYGADAKADEGSNIYAMADGIITVVNDGGWNSGYGNYVEIDHGNGYTTRYAHMKKTDTTPFATGDKVKQGEVIGYVGKTGWATGPHLHIELRLRMAWR